MTNLNDENMSGWGSFAARYEEHEATERAANNKADADYAAAINGQLPDDFDPAADTSHPALTVEQIFAARAAAKRVKK